VAVEAVCGKVVSGKTALDGALRTKGRNDFFTSRFVFQADFIFFKHSLAFRKNMVY
jgi:hypothetical protein